MIERLILPWEITRTVCYSGGDFKWDYEGTAEQQDEFFAEFDILGNRLHANPDEDYYQGLDFAAVIIRKRDGKKFGYGYWEDISKHGEAFVESNSYDYGLDDDYAAWFPVEEFTITGYKIIEKEDE